MSQREPFEYIEIDMDFCGLEYGTAPCDAVLGTTGVRKCFNTFRTCQSENNFSKTVKTLRFCKSISSIPVGELFFPALIGVTARSSSVNIGGTDDRLAAFGRRASLAATFKDFPYHDRFMDPYQSERVSGAAQSDGIGYIPEENGLFFARLRARWPYYSGRAIRHVEAYIDGGSVTVVRTSHFIITDFEVDRSGRVTFKGRDPLDIANNDKALVPLPVNGVLGADISSSATSLTLSPAGIGDESYPSEGRAVIDSEYVSFTRSGDTITLTGRGIEGTSVSAHGAGDDFQTSYSIEREQIGTVLKSLLVDFAGLDPAFIPDAKWDAELSRWFPDVVLTTDIIKPENVGDIVNEIAILGLSIWWDEDLQEVGLKTIRPIADDTLYVLTDENSIKDISFEDRDGDRLTEILISSVLSDPTQSPDDPKSYKRGRYLVDVSAKSENAYSDTQFKEINCRLLNHGDEKTVRTSGRRILNRLRVAPRRYRITLDAKDRAIGLTDVLEVTSRDLVDEAGRPQPTLMQVIERGPIRSGHDFYVIAQSYTYDSRFPFIMENDAPIYDLATDEQRNTGAYLVDGATLRFNDTSGPYELI